MVKINVPLINATFGFYIVCGNEYGLGAGNPMHRTMVTSE